MNGRRAEESGLEEMEHSERYEGVHMVWIDIQSTLEERKKERKRRIWNERIELYR